MAKPRTSMQIECLSQYLLGPIAWNHEITVYTYLWNRICTHLQRHVLTVTDQVLGLLQLPLMEEEDSVLIPSFFGSSIFQGAPFPVLKCGLGGIIPGKSPWNTGLTTSILQSTMIGLGTCDPSQPIPSHWDSISWLLLKLLGKKSPLFWRSCDK